MNRGGYHGARGFLLEQHRSCDAPTWSCGYCPTALMPMETERCGMVPSAVPLLSCSCWSTRVVTSTGASKACRYCSPLFRLQSDDNEDKVRVLLAQPCLDLTYRGKTPGQYARDCRKPAVADMLAQEVSKTALLVVRIRCWC